jgi:tetratricopeptide (TPR) repeat protein
MTFSPQPWQIRRFGSLIAVALALMLFSGCGPPGPLAVLEGKKLIEEGQYAQAIEELRAATELLPTNALAYNYLGLAYHQAGQPVEAERAYLRALTLNHDLTEVHYDLGCLWLSQNNKLDQAKSELTTYTLRRPNSTEGWLKLGEAQYRSRELTAAEKSLGEALRLDPRNPEALTSIGLVRYQRRRASEAAQFFSKALQEQPNYAPALLNLAIVAQQDLNDPRLALRTYRQYLALKPAPENFQAVSAIVHQLDQELTPPVIEPATNAAVQAATRTNGIRAPMAELSHTSNVPKPSVTNATKIAVLPKVDLATNLVKSSVPTNPPKSAPVTSSVPPEKVEIVTLSAEPVIKPADDVGNAPVIQRTQEPTALAEATTNTFLPSTAKPQKRGFFQRINPINLFARDTKTSPAGTTPLTSAGNQATAQAKAADGSNDGIDKADAPKFPRYAYRSPDKPAAGDRSAAERAFAQGVQYQEARQLPEAIQAYRRAAQLNPGFYDAHYNLGLAASQNGNLSLALLAYETALAIQPESLDARYNFGLVLRQAGFVPDAVVEFEKILNQFPNDGRTHLALGNLYAQQLQDPVRARQHYLAVLALAPQSPQAGAIRYWLTDHPK